MGNLGDKRDLFRNDVVILGHLPVEPGVARPDSGVVFGYQDSFIVQFNNGSVFSDSQY